MTGYETVQRYSEQTEIKRSLFIAEIYHVTSEEELFTALSELRKKYSDATHVCYGSVFDKTGNGARFSADGEPGGTAGAPILEAIKQSGIKEVLVAVVRYFGGVKLGAGGLVRAYSSACSSALKNAPKVYRLLCDVYSLTIDFSKAKRVIPSFPKVEISVLDTVYTDCVTLTIAVESGREIEGKVAEMLAEKPKLTKLYTD